MGCILYWRVLVSYRSLFTGLKSPSNLRTSWSSTIHFTKMLQAISWCWQKVCVISRRNNFRHKLSKSGNFGDKPLQKSISNQHTAFSSKKFYNSTILQWTTFTNRYEHQNDQENQHLQRVQKETNRLLPLQNHSFSPPLHLLQEGIMSKNWWPGPCTCLQRIR